ncbi:MAG: M48 family metalloprotease [Thiolinea sp.]
MAMLLAHEIAHVKLRHPVRALGQNLAISSGIKLLMGYSNVRILGNTGLYTQLHFSRAMETACDLEGLAAVQAVYGHASGATDLFKALQQLHRRDSPDEPASAFFSTHPLDQQRIDQLTRLAEEQGWLHGNDQVTPLPAEFQDWLVAEQKPE